MKKLSRAGLSNEDIKYFYRWVEKKTFVAVATDFGVTPQAVQKRFKKKIFPALKKINPRFSVQALRSNIHNFEINQRN
jgi:hypothetical protein